MTRSIQKLQKQPKTFSEYTWYVTEKMILALFSAELDDFQKHSLVIKILCSAQTGFLSNRSNRQGPNFEKPKLLILSNQEAEFSIYQFVSAW